MPAASDAITLSTAQYRVICKLVHRHFGIHLTPDRQTMVETRLRTMLRTHGLPQRADIVEDILQKRPTKLTSALIDSLTTNHTYFGRGEDHFKTLLNRVLPEVTAAIPAAHRDLRIWCAASSTGQEPYNIAMTVLQHLGAARPSWRAGLLATDLSSEVLAVARRGIYDADALDTVDSETAARHFEKLPNGQLKASASLRGEIVFRRFNLMTARYPFRRKFHIVFCRNVLIYFDDRDRAAVIERIRRSLEPKGWLFLGMSETLPAGLGFDRIEPALYRRTE